MSAVTNDTQALVTGALVAMMHGMVADYREGNPKAFLKILSVDLDTDEEGNYLNTFTMTFESGTVLSVTVSEVTEIPEQP